MSTGGVGVDIGEKSWYKHLVDEIGEVIAESNEGSSIGYENVVLQVGANEHQLVEVKLHYMRMKDLTTKDIDVTTQEDAEATIKVLQEVLALVSSRRSYLGSKQNRLESTYSVDALSEENLTSAQSRIEDADMASEMS